MKNKKTILILILFALFLSACNLSGLTADSQITTISETSISTDLTNPIESSINSDIIVEDDKCIDFLESLKNHDMDKLYMYGGLNSPEAYDFLKNTTIISYEIQDRTFYDDKSNRYATYTVKLNISESENEVFPIGESIWELTHISSEMASFAPFHQKGYETKDDITYNTKNVDYPNAVRFCTAFTTYMGYSFGEKLSENNLMEYTPYYYENSKASATGLIKFLFDIKYPMDFSEELYHSNRYPTSWINKALNDTIGFNELNFSEYWSYDSLSDSLSLSLLGG